MLLGLSEDVHVDRSSMVPSDSFSNLTHYFLTYIIILSSYVKRHPLRKGGHKFSEFAAVYLRA